ncbi:hypothetical protein VTI28DRAFT_7159 [Corynascus sepedonium]
MVNGTKAMLYHQLSRTGLLVFFRRLDDPYWNDWNDGIAHVFRCLQGVEPLVHSSFAAPDFQRSSLTTLGPSGTPTNEASDIVSPRKA